MLLLPKPWIFYDKSRVYPVINSNKANSMIPNTKWEKKFKIGEACRKNMFFRLQSYFSLIYLIGDFSFYKYKSSAIRQQKKYWDVSSKFVSFKTFLPRCLLNFALLSVKQHWQSHFNPFIFLLQKFSIWVFVFLLHCWL